MLTDQAFELISPCGINCADCSVYKVKDHPELKAVLLAHGLKEEQLPCPGCRAMEGACPHLDAPCENYACAKEHQVTMCFECDSFPCEKLHPAADRANVLPHNMKVFSQCYIQKHGVQAWLEKLPEIRLRYFKGIISYGKGPRLEGEK